MMRRGNGPKITPPTQTEAAHSGDESVLVAVGGTKSGPLIYLKLAFHSDDIHIVAIDETAACRLVGVLKALFPRFESIVASEATQGAEGLEVAEGYRSA